MRFLHLADLHIGKRVNEFSMIEDQRYILNQILDIVKEQEVQCVLIAGDIYDKAVPSAEAVLLLDQFISRLAEMNVKVVAISGNHDSPERIGFGAEIMSTSGVYMSHPLMVMLKRLLWRMNVDQLIFICFLLLSRP
ncbi:MAG: metallophosphoesterase family protein [Eubacterium ventriosum]